MQSFLVVALFGIFSVINYCEGASVPLKGRIVGGRAVSIDECPYAVSLRRFDSHICGGSIIAPDTILTAAHCVFGQISGSLSIRHGSTYADLGISHKVTEVIQHPNFNTGQVHNTNDVALLKISPSIVYTKSSQPAQLADTRSPDSSEAVICGWGLHYENEESNNLGKRELQAVTINVIDQQECESDYSDMSPLDNTLMCAAGKDKDNCKGDSGGGLMDNGRQQLIGISSWGKGCSESGKPGVYASVPELLGFIRNNL